MGRLMQAVNDVLVPGFARDRRRFRSCRRALATRRSTSMASTADSRSTDPDAVRRRSLSRVFDRRFLLEEGFDAARQEIAELVARVARDAPDVRFDVRDLMVVHPTKTPDDSPVNRRARPIDSPCARKSASARASPGTYDHKHVARIAGVPPLRRVRSRRARAGASSPTSIAESKTS